MVNRSSYGSDDKEFAFNAGDQSSIPGLGRSAGKGNGYPLQYSCLKNPMDRGAWWATDYGVAKNWPRLSHSHLMIQRCRCVTSQAGSEQAVPLLLSSLGMLALGRSPPSGTAFLPWESQARKAFWSQPCWASSSSQHPQASVGVPRCVNTQPSGAFRWLQSLSLSYCNLVRKAMWQQSSHAPLPDLKTHKIIKNDRFKRTGFWFTLLRFRSICFTGPTGKRFLPFDTPSHHPGCS